MATRVMAEGRDSASGAWPGSLLAPGDAWGGLAAMLVAFPSSMAFGVVIFTAASPDLAGAGALAGIMGAAAMGVVAPLVGRNGGFITAPCAPAAAVMSGLAATLVARGDLPVERVVALLGLTALSSAVLQLLYGGLGAGRIIKYIPYQVVTGYLSGVAVIIAMAQLPVLLGVPAGTGAHVALFQPELWSGPALGVGVATMGAMVLAPAVRTRIPGAVLGLGAGIVVYFAVGFLLQAVLLDPGLLRLAGNDLVVGPIEASGALLQGAVARAASLGSLGGADLALVFGTAVTLSVLLSIDTLKTGVVLDAVTRRRHDSDRELLGQGLANAASFFAGGVPGAGTLGPTLVNVTSGGRTPASGVVEGALVLLVFLVLGDLVAWVPVAALAGILLVIAWRMFDFGVFRLLLEPSTRLDFLVIASVVAVTQVMGLIQAAGVGVFLAILLFIRDQMRTSVIHRKADLTEVRSKRRRPPEAVAVLADRGRDGALVQLEDDLFFGTTDQLFSELERDLVERRFILLDFRRVQSVDYTAVHLLRQMQERLRDREGHLLIAGLPSGAASRQDIEHYMGQLGLLGRDGISIFETRDSALEWMEDRILEGAGLAPPESRPPLALGEIGVFRRLSPDLLGQLAGRAGQISFAAGTPIFATGDGGDEMYVVRRGVVHILLPLEGGKRHHVATLARGELFGEMTFLDGRPRSADAETASDVDLYAFSRAHLDRLLRRQPVLAAQLFEALALILAERMRTADGEIRALEDR